MNVFSLDCNEYCLTFTLLLRNFYAYIFQHQHRDFYSWSAQEFSSVSYFADKKVVFLAWRAAVKFIIFRRAFNTELTFSQVQGTSRLHVLLNIHRHSRLLLFTIVIKSHSLGGSDIVFIRRECTASYYQNILIILKLNSAYNILQFWHDNTFTSIHRWKKWICNIFTLN